MSKTAVSLSFFDGRHDLCGTLREGLVLLFDGDRPAALPEPPGIEPKGGGWRATLAERIALEFEPVSQAVTVEGDAVRVCRARGTVGGRQIDCLGAAVEVGTPPRWSEIDARRTIAALFDDDHAVFALAERPRGALTHGDERVSAALVAGGEAVAVEQARLSTVYDADGRQRSASLELWLTEEDFPRRLSGTARAGASLTLEQVEVGAAVFDWRMEGRAGLGSYELAVRVESEAA